MRHPGLVPPLAALAVVTLTAALDPASASSQTLRGILSEQDTYAPIELGTVYLTTIDMDTLASRVTGPQGFFEFAVPEEGSYFLVASALGYRAVRSDVIEVTESSFQVVELRMRVRPVPIEGVRVAADPNEPEVPGLVGTGFYDRVAENMARGRGEFIFPGQIAASEAEYVQALFWGMETVRVHQTRPQGQGRIIARLDGTVAGGRRRARDTEFEAVGPWTDILVIPNRTGPGYCSPSIYVDGIWLRELNPGEALADVVSVDDLLGVEVYEWPFGVPRRYTGGQACGVILFWTDGG